MKYILSVDRVEEGMAVLTDIDGDEVPVPVNKISGKVLEGVRVIISVSDSDAVTDSGKSEKSLLKNLLAANFTAYVDTSYDKDVLRKKRLDRMAALFGKNR